MSAPQLRHLGAGVVLLLMAAGASAQTSQVALPPTAADDLAAAEALFRLGDDVERKPVPVATSRVTYGAHVDLALTASAGEPRTTLAFDTMTRPRLGSSYVFKTDELLQPMASRVYPSARLTVNAEWEALDWLLVRGLVDTGQIREGSQLEPAVAGLVIAGSPAGDAITSLDIVRELSVTLGKRSFTLEIGRFRTGLADGLVYDGFGAGARVRLDLNPIAALAWRVELVAVGLADRLSRTLRNPLLALRIVHELSLFESVSVFGAWVWDDNGALSDVLRSALAERALNQPRVLDALFSNDRGYASLAFAGADAQLVLAPGLLLRAAVTGSIGAFSIAVGGAFGSQERQRHFDLLAGAANAELRYDLGSSFEGVAYAFALSGDGPPQQGKTYHAFMSPAPYWIWTGLFFSGGLNQSLFEDRAALGGVHGHGVAGGGPGLTWTNKPWLVDVRALWLQALSAPPSAPWGGGGRSYGLECDVRGKWRVIAGLDLGAEVDVLFAADYFPVQRVAYRALGIVSYTYAN